jgi:Flp pilus assembly protein TadG
MLRVVRAIPARLLRRFVRDRKGQIAVEMALVGPPFLLVLLAIIDFGLTLATQSVLDGAARDAARLIRTGQVSAQGNAPAVFQNLLCADMSSLMSVADCNANVVFEVQVFPNFGAIGTNGFGACAQNAQGGTVCPFNPGAGGQVIGVRTSYARPYLIPWVGACLSGGTCWAGLGTSSSGSAGTGTTTLVSTVIFRNEPF